MAPQKKVLGYLAFGMVVAAFVISVVAMMPMLPMLAEAVTSTQFGNQEAVSYTHLDVYKRQV